MIICKNNLDPILHNIGSNEILEYEITLIFIIDKELNSERILFVSLYKPPKIRSRIKQWQDLFDKITQTGISSQLFVLGDLNAQNEAWGYKK